MTPAEPTPARLIAWLVTDEAAWITGQVINTEGGFRRLQPFLCVGEILVARVLGEFGFEVGDDPSDVVLGAPVVA